MNMAIYCISNRIFNSKKLKTMHDYNNKTFTKPETVSVTATVYHSTLKYLSSDNLLTYSGEKINTVSLSFQ